MINNYQARLVYLDKSIKTKPFKSIYKAQSRMLYKLEYHHPYACAELILLNSNEVIEKHRKNECYE